MEDTKTYYVYALIHNGKPIYVGCTSNKYKREKAHRKLKKFDHLFSIKEYSNKKEALIAECAIIRFLSILKDDNITNSLYVNLLAKKEYADSTFN